MKKIVKAYSSFLAGMDVEVTLQNGQKIELTKEERDDGWYYSADGISGEIYAKTDGKAVIYYAKFESDTPFADRFAVTLKSGFKDDDKITVSALDYGTVYWLYPKFPKTASDFPYTVSNLLVKRGDLHYDLTMLLGEEFRTEWDMNGLHLSSLYPNTSLEGSFLAVCAASDPYTAIRECYKHASRLGGIRVPLVTSRPMPKVFRGFGYCTWNTFYHDVSSAGIYEKLDEFKKKGVPVNWMIIDDGWASVNKDEQLFSLTEDRKKFPEGLKECIRRVKEEYGVKYVGIWHTLNFWWFGIDPESELAEKYSDCFSWSKFVPGKDTLDRMLIPCDEPEKVYRFWDDWHGYLEECGVDFVKIDNQSSAFYYLSGCRPASSGTRHLHEAIEPSIEKHFGGVAIDCMGMEMANALSRPYTAVTRSSDDFYPNNPDGFYKHLTQNAYNALWHSQIYHCDYDMWWSGKSNPVESGLLRAISGGPVYVSDAIGDTNLENISPLCESDGRLIMFDHAALPTSDEIYEDMSCGNRPFKVFNKMNDCAVLAVFNPSFEKAEDKFRLDVIPDLDPSSEYVAYEYFSKRFSRVSSSSEMTVSLSKNEALAYSFFPIMNDKDGEYILFGDSTKYFPAAMQKKARMPLDEIVF